MKVYFVLSGMVRLSTLQPIIMDLSRFKVYDVHQSISTTVRVGIRVQISPSFPLNELSRSFLNKWQSESILCLVPGHKSAFGAVSINLYTNYGIFHNFYLMKASLNVTNKIMKYFMFV